MEAGTWQSKPQRLREVHAWRPRRREFGEMVQWDTSEHEWLEGRGTVRYLVRMIDDATGLEFGTVRRDIPTEQTPLALRKHSGILRHRRGSR